MVFHASISRFVVRISRPCTAKSADAISILPAWRIQVRTPSWHFHNKCGDGGSVCPGEMTGSRRHVPAPEPAPWPEPAPRRWACSRHRTGTASCGELQPADLAAGIFVAVVGQAGLDVVENHAGRDNAGLLQALDGFGDFTGRADAGRSE